ncbi:hypothetical protein M0R45_031061 [Rubus argutus]|uniref:non-specific serine/threonine protein kinase n=1 Tax=Rubus argutus TaxID=59490 RepID=A0AAW1WG41_RUBAR
MYLSILHVSINYVMGNEEPKRVFTFTQLAAATQNFIQQLCIGEGGTSKVYKGHLQETGQIVAVKRLDKTIFHRVAKEFEVEVQLLGQLRHQNVVFLIGHCIEGEEILLVYEFMELGSLADQLHDPSLNKAVLSWRTRVEVALGVAKGLAYLHDPSHRDHHHHHPVIHRDLKSSNILLDANFVPKISDFGISKFEPVGENTHVSTQVKATFGFLAPEYVLSGHLTTRADVYSFGVVLWELSPLGANSRKESN